MVYSKVGVAGRVGSAPVTGMVTSKINGLVPFAGDAGDKF
jgi:hypothetical protein